MEFDVSFYGSSNESDLDQLERIICGGLDDADEEDQRQLRLGAALEAAHAAQASPRPARESGFGDQEGQPAFFFGFLDPCRPPPLSQGLDLRSYPGLPGLPS